jgi:predicted dehydrogenase
MINLAILSCAHIHTKDYLKTVAEREGVRLAAVGDDVPARGRRYAEEYGADFSGDLDHVVGRDDVHGFIICAENTRHLPLLQAAIPAGKPIFCEKPFTTNVAEAAAALTLIRQGGAIVHMGYQLPFRAEMRGVAALLAAGTLGTVTHARFRNAHHAAYARWFDNPDLAWFADPKLAGGGALMDMGTHAVHLLRTLLGPVDRVCATIRNVSGAYPAVDDHGIAWLQFASGVLGEVEASWIQTGGPSGLEITGSGGTLCGDGKGGYVITAPQKDAVTAGLGDERPRQVDRLIAAIRGKLSREELQNDLLCAADAVAIVQACYESSRTGQWVDVPKV